MPTDDYIKRSDALEEVQYIPVTMDDEIDVEAAQQMINAIPAVDVEPVRHGRWIRMTGMMPPEFHGHYECSECEWRGKHDIEREYHYCPNCGAKMDEDEGGRRWQ